MRRISTVTKVGGSQRQTEGKGLRAKKDRRPGEAGRKAGAEGAAQGSVSEPLLEATPCHTSAVYKDPSTVLLGRNAVYTVCKIYTPLHLSRLSKSGNNPIPMETQNVISCIDRVEYYSALKKEILMHAKM